MNEAVKGQSADLITLRFDGDIAIVGLNRPEKRNALSDRLVEALADTIATVNKKARAVVLHGHGKHFSAGLDLSEHISRSTTEGMAHSRGWHHIFERIEQASIPWISAIHGATVGGGLELAAATHIRVADEDAYFALPEGQRGIFVGGGGSVRISRLIGAARMIDMMLTGRVVTAEVAERWNLVQYLTEKGKSLEKALELAARIVTNAPFSNYAIINALPRIHDLSRSDGLFLESALAAISAGTDDAKQRLREFLDKKSGKVEKPGGDR